MVNGAGNGSHIAVSAMGNPYGLCQIGRQAEQQAGRPRGLAQRWAQSPGKQNNGPHTHSSQGHTDAAIAAQVIGRQHQIGREGINHPLLGHLQMPQQVRGTDHLQLHGMQPRGYNKQCAKRQNCNCPKQPFAGNGIHLLTIPPVLCSFQTDKNTFVFMIPYLW